MRPIAPKAAHVFQKSARSSPSSSATDLRGVRLLADLDDAIELVSHWPRTVELDDQDRASLREAGVHSDLEAASMVSASIISIAAGTIPLR